MSSLCNFCGFEMPDGEKVCTRCGRAAEKSSPGEATLPVCRCSKCGKEFPAGVKFCSECGGKVSYGSAAMDKKGALPGKEFSVDMGGGVSMTLIRIEPGTFMMGSPEDELGRYDNEEQHSVTLTRPFWIGKYPVTQREYEVLMDTNPSDSKGDELPVENVSWDDAHAFCEHLNRQYAGRLPAGYRFDLPTEAQWEYACRAGTTTALNNGKNLTSEDERCPNLDEVAWYDENSGYRTHKVGRKKPNAWGLYDMHGNVLEWCRDWYEKEYASDAEFLNGQPKSGERVFRGGCDARYCRSANRDYAPPDDGDFLGFRLALVPGEQLNYNENRRASCLALCESAEEKAIYASRWDNELQNYFFQQRHGNSSADKGLDLFLHTVEMLTLLLDGKGGKMEEKWRDFIVAGHCADYPASIEIVKEYLYYRQALKVYTRLNGDDQEANAPMIAFLSGEWGNNKSQIDAISIFVSLELLKGQTYISEELKQNYFNCRLFFKNLYRHASVVSNPQNYIVDFLKLARILRENSLDILILPQVQNPLLTAEEKWRLHFLERRKQILGVEDVYKTLVLLDDISSPTVLRGEVTILFAVAFNGNGMDEILNGCMSTSFDELNMKLTQAKEVMCRHFNWTSLSETVRKLLLYGECFITRGRGMWYPCDLGLNARSWIDYWYDRMRPSGDALMVNEHIVSFLRMNGALPENNQPVDVEFSLLQQIASNDLAGQRFFDMVRNDSWTEGRFRSVDGWKPEFKGYKSILWFLSEEIRQGISHDGIRLNIDYRKGDAEHLEIVISKPAAEGTEPHADIVIPFRQEGDWEQYQLNEIIKSFRETGQF